MTTWEEYFKTKTDKELIEEYKNLHETINVIQCFDSKDVTRFYMIENELIERGYKITERVDVRKGA